MATPLWTDPSGPDLDPDVVIRAAVGLYPWFKKVKSGFASKASMDSENAVRLVSRFSEMFQLRHWYRQWDGDFKDRLEAAVAEFKLMPPALIERVIMADTLEEAMALVGWINDKEATPKVEVNGHPCFVRTFRYSHGGRISLDLFCLSNGEDYTRATVNIPGVVIADDEVLVKDYSENEGVLKALVDAQVVHPPTRTVPSGFVVVHCCRLNAEKFPILLRDP